MIHPISARPIKSILHGLCLAAVVVTVIAVSPYDTASAQSNAVQAIVGETNAKTPEVSTADVRRILSDGSAILVDSRKRGEYVAGHIAGARNATNIEEIGTLAGGDKSKALVLYCNGQNCQASRTLSEQLVSAGFTNIKRYQLGIPMWRALNGPVEIELEGVLRIYKVDQTAKFFDARAAAEFAKVNLPGTHNVPADQLATDGLRKAPMPSEDFNTRIILFGRDGAQARTLADAILKGAMQNVSYFPGTFEALAAAVKTQ